MSIYDFIHCCEYKMSFLPNALRIIAPDSNLGQYERNMNTFDFDIPLEIAAQYRIISIIPDVVDEDYTIFNIICEKMS